MLTLQIVLACIAAAMICACVRIQRPEMAMGISLAVGLAVILALWQEFQSAGIFAKQIQAMVNMDDELFQTVAKAAGIAIVSEMGAQICTDAGEKTLAGRIGLASRMAMLALCGPMLEKMMGYLEKLSF